MPDDELLAHVAALGDAANTIRSSDATPEERDEALGDAADIANRLTGR
ncbi:hypothetical protein RM844_28600 [Streptomyces sp. DSM 44915]|uniref:Uncharacterized protein n=1 Tax=Streptomyces chisholmiae TaxID=3075540 RepID=A0ABU2JZ11_9ACTN|nr:hypothetical protein [Streptomyces sp. DSM 44915]MDT0270237.1 hypothetical protein [Streptomyces sp. DSM 44915]